MANEITMTASITVSKGSAAINSGTLTKQLTLTADHMHGTSFTAATGAGTAVPLGAVTTPGGYVLIRNNDVTNFVSLTISAASVIKIRPGCLALFQPVAAITAIADTTACKCQVWMVDI